MEQGKLFVSTENMVRNVGGGVLTGHVLFLKIISLENIFCAWREFQKDKRNRTDVKEFEANAEEEIFKLCDDLKMGKYKHGSYKAFWVRDPKLRLIHKASVRDRLLHHAIFRVLYPIFNKSWIFDSFSSRESKGTHAAMKRFRDFAWNISQNNTRDVWVLKLDIRKYFDSIDHEILLSLLYKALPYETSILKDDDQFFDLLKNNIHSYSTLLGKGIPLGNLTSQLFANVYLNPLDQYVKRRLGVAYYIRYADDIIVFSESQEFLLELLSKISSFLENELRLTIHPKKISIRRWSKGIDVLGFISYPLKTIMRPSTERRMFKRLHLQLTWASFDEQLNALYSRVKFEQ
jgi:retron-type reverse transcriptase